MPTDNRIQGQKMDVIRYHNDPNVQLIDYLIDEAYRKYMPGAPWSDFARNYFGYRVENLFADAVMCRACTNYQQVIGVFPSCAAMDGLPVRPWATCAWAKK